MKDKDNKKRNGLIPFAIMLVIGLLLLKYLIGISFWLILGIIIFFAIVQFIWPGIEVIYKSKPVAILLVVLFLGSLGKFFWQTNYPRSFNKMGTTQDLLDQGLSKIMGDSTEKKAVDIWEVEKAKASQAFLVYYSHLLAKGKTVQAADTLEKFNQKWDMDFLKEQAKSSSKEKTENVTPVSSSSSTAKDLQILTEGTYVFQLKAGGETPWFGFPQGKNWDFKISSPTEDRKTFVSDGTCYLGNTTIPRKKHCYFKVRVSSAQFVTVTVRVI
jgi:hypothetical protein